MTPVSDAARITVLHVEDDAGFADLTAEFLRRNIGDVEVVTAASPAEGADVLADRAVDCLVSDYDMPGRTGIEFLESVRETHPDLPFILFTGKGSEEVASRAFSAGATDYLQKEPGTDQYIVLANKVTNYVEKYRTERQMSRRAQAMETANDGIAILDADGRYTEVNEAYAELSGRTPSAMVGDHWTVTVPDAEAERLRAEAFPEMEETGSWTGEALGLRADGDTYAKLLSLSALEDGHVCVIRDITRRKERATVIEELHETARSFMAARTAEAVAERSVDAVRDVLGMPINGVHLYDEAEDRLLPVAWTDEGEALVDELPSFAPNEGIAGSVYESGEERLHNDVSSDPDRFNRDTAVRSEIYLPLGDHGILLIGSSEPNAFDEADASLARILAAHATTALDRIDRERKLERQNERLEKFASVVSHDLRNPLNVAEGRLALARDDPDGGHLDGVADAHDRIRALIDDLLSLARAGERPEDAEEVSLAALARDCWQRVDAPEATLVVETDRVVRADRRRLQQVLRNLLHNSVEHGGDAVTVTVGDLPDGFYVADDGVGVSDADRDSVFDTGFSGSPDGTGFGLSIVEEAARTSGWTVSLADGDGGGARFEVTGVDRADSVEPAE